MPIQVAIVSAESEIYSGFADTVTAPGAMGELGIKPKHAPLLAELKPGEVRLESDGEAEKLFYISGGYIEVQPDRVTVLADTALRGDEIDEAQANEALARARESLKNQQDTDFDYQAALSEIAQAVAQLRTLSKLRKDIEKM